jgi:hypothetical protein
VRQKRKRNVPIAKAKDAKRDYRPQQSGDADYWSAAYGITKHRLADAIKAVGSLRAKRQTRWQHD